MKTVINIQKLTEYGFDDEIIEAMIKHEIMFPVEKKTRAGDTQYFVKKADVLYFLNTIVKNSMKVYDAVEKVEEVVEKAAEEVEKSQDLLEVLNGK